MFKVVPDQLRVSDGWVRCGQCNEVFDANLNLQADTLPKAEPEGYSNTLDATATATATATADPPEIQDRDPFLVVNSHALHLEPETFLDDAPGADEPLEEVEDQNVLAPADASVSSESAAEHSFLRPTPVPSVWMNRSVRILLSMACVLLGLVLALQIVIRERDRIAALLPGTKEALVAVCELAGCTVAPMRQIDAVIIDSSSFTKVRADVYRLSFALKNTAHTSVATPALELTLTDLQDRPVVRRVFTTQDFGVKSGAMEAGAELSVNMPLNLKLDNHREKISGYKLLSFYP